MTAPDPIGMPELPEGLVWLVYPVETRHFYGGDPQIEIRVVLSNGQKDTLGSGNVDTVRAISQNHLGALVRKEARTIWDEYDRGIRVRGWIEAKPWLKQY